MISSETYEDSAKLEQLEEGILGLAHKLYSNKLTRFLFKDLIDELDELYLLAQSL